MDNRRNDVPAQGDALDGSASPEAPAGDTDEPATSKPGAVGEGAERRIRPKVRKAGPPRPPGGHYTSPVSRDEPLPFSSPADLPTPNETIAIGPTSTIPTIRADPEPPASSQFAPPRPGPAPDRNTFPGTDMNPASVLEMNAVEPADRVHPTRGHRPPRPVDAPIHPNLSGRQALQGQHPGDRYVRIVRPRTDDFAFAGPGRLIAKQQSLAERGPVGRTAGRVKRLLIGSPLSTEMASHERLSKPKALAVLSSDALSSVAYATEEILRVLLIAGGVAALSVSLPIGLAIIVLLLIVGVSYRQTIKAYPNGGGSYIVAKDNLGEIPALTAGGALLVDYILTVAVSVAAAVAALSSVFNGLNEHRVLVGIGFVTLVTILNLRGIRESGTIFAVPTFLFLGGIALMLVVGITRNALAGFPVLEPEVVPTEDVAAAGTLTLFVALRAFSAGCTALTGVEAISDGVPAFRKPEWSNARTTLTIMIVTLAVMFGGITWLAHQYGTLPLDQDSAGYETVVYQVAQRIFEGWGPVPALFIQFSTMAILVLAANTAYSDFPRLSYFLARDRYMPRQFTFRGDRLAFTTGIVTLGVLSSAVLAIFGGETERLIPLYALGVFTSFTISQLGMVVRWQRRREPGWRTGRILNGFGATATAVVALIVAVTKFAHGAWVVMLLIPLLILTLRGIHRHYEMATRELATPTPLDPSAIHHTVLVPIAGVNRVAQQTLAYARSMSSNVTAVHIAVDEDDIDGVQQAWDALDIGVPLVIIESPYRSLVGPLLSYIDEIDRQRPGDTLTVILPEFIARHWWEHILHNQTGLRIKAALLFKPGIVVTSVPYHLDRGGEGAPIPGSPLSAMRRRL
ncbi:MAG TPA: amino acid permease [Thermomicrobiales bacterium]|nr:amino acid permease [Thermomicrobiales bacterium]